MCTQTKMNRQDTKKIAEYYDSIEYHEKARDFASKMKFRRLLKIREMPSHEGGVLELGCSSSVYSNDFDNWVGLDISKAVLTLNKNKSAVQASALKLPFRETCFSLVMMFNLIEHLHDPEAALLEAIRVLKHGGLLAIGSPPLIWELFLSGDPSNYKRKKRIEQVFAEGLLSVTFVAAMLKHVIPILKEFYHRMKDETLITIGRTMLPLRPIFLEPDYNLVGEDFDAIYAYNPNALVNFLRSRDFEIIDLRPLPARVFRLPTSDVEAIIARKAHATKHLTKQK